MLANKLPTVLLSASRAATDAGTTELDRWIYRIAARLNSVLLDVLDSVLKS